MPDAVPLLDDNFSEKNVDSLPLVVKLRDYCLNTHHPKGRSKAELFLEVFGNNSAFNFNKIASLAYFLIDKTKPKYLYEIEEGEYGVKYKYLVPIPPHSGINLS